MTVARDEHDSEAVSGTRWGFESLWHWVNLREGVN